MSPINRRQALTLAAAAASTPLVSRTAQAAYPEKPVRMIIPIAPGGGTNASTISASMSWALFARSPRTG